MRKPNVRQLVNEMDMMLEDKPSLMLENFMMPEDDVPMGDDVPMQDAPVGDDAGMNDMGPQVPNDDVSAEISQIRQTAIQAIARLADNPGSASYQLMKKIWNLCDKQLETPKDVGVGGDMDLGF
ncbi:MAG: hypothetical protein LUD72_06900 [Bacteroidales bacterium]|nr:hypothetical protein [Bacteroidales bacterium]